MNSIELIAKHLEVETSKMKIVECDTVCAITGTAISHGIAKKEIAGGTFNNYEIFRFDSKYISVESAKCIMQVLKNKEKGTLNSLRNFSYLATNYYIKILKREDLWDILINPPAAPFVLAYTFNAKKHTSIKAQITTNIDKIKVITDNYDLIILNRNDLDILLPIIQNWYSATEDMSKTDTFFTKEEILNGTDNVPKIRRHGADKYYLEDSILNKYRNTNILTLLTRLVNRCVLK